MSRSSRKSDLSPSATGSNIDLGKNDGVDMGRKTQPSVTSGGLGVSTEITNIRGISVIGGVSANISPINLGINYDPAENSVSVASGAEIPGGLLGVSGGVIIDLDSGEITGGSLGGEALGLGVNVSSSKDGGLGIEFTVQIPFTPIEVSLGFGFPPKGKTPISPSPSPSPSSWKPPVLPTGDPNKHCQVVIAIQTRDIGYDLKGNLAWHIEYKSSGSYSPQTESVTVKQEMLENYPYNVPPEYPKNYPNSTFIRGAFGFQQFWGIDGNNRIVNTSNNPADPNYQPADIVIRLTGKEDKIYNFLNSQAYYVEKSNTIFFNRTRIKIIQ